MTTEKFKNIYRFSAPSLDEIRGLIRDLQDPGITISKEERRERIFALEQLKKEKLQKV